MARLQIQASFVEIRVQIKARVCYVSKSIYKQVKKQGGGDYRYAHL